MDIQQFRYKNPRLSFNAEINLIKVFLQNSHKVLESSTPKKIIIKLPTIIKTLRSTIRSSINFQDC